MTKPEPNQISKTALIEIENILNRAFPELSWQTLNLCCFSYVRIWSTYPCLPLPEPEQVSKALNLRCSWEDSERDSYKIESGKIIYSAEIDPWKGRKRICTYDLLHYQDVYEISGSTQEFVGRVLSGLEIRCNSQDPECDCFYHFWEPDVDYADCDVRFERNDE